MSIEIPALILYPTKFGMGEILVAARLPPLGDMPIKEVSRKLEFLVGKYKHEYNRIPTFDLDVSCPRCQLLLPGNTFTWARERANELSVRLRISLNVPTMMCAVQGNNYAVRRALFEAHSGVH